MSEPLGQVAVTGPIPGPVRQMCARADGATPSALGIALPCLDVVDVMLADRELGRRRHTAADLQVDRSAIAILCRRSSTSDGLATAWIDSTRLGRGTMDRAQAGTGRTTLLNILKQQLSTLKLQPKGSAMLELNGLICARVQALLPH